MNMHLHLGKLEGDVLECPYHSAKFDVKDGKVVASHNAQVDAQLKRMGLIPIPTRPLKTYPVNVQEGIVSVLL